MGMVVIEILVNIIVSWVELICILSLIYLFLVSYLYFKVGVY